MVDVIQLGTKRDPFGIVGSLPVIKFLKSPKTTIGLAATLAAITPGGRAAAFGATKLLGRGIAKRPILTLIGLPTAIGALGASPILRKIGKEVIDPRKSLERGEKLGELIEGKEGLGDKLLKGAKTAGLIGAGAAVVGLGGAAIVKAVKGRKKKEEVVLDVAPISVIPGVPESLEPLAPVEKPVIPVVAGPKPVSVKNVFKPSVDISFKKNKKFINQQVIVK